MSVRKSSHGTIFLIASSLRSTSKKPFCPMTRSLHPPMTACGHRVRFVATWREEFFEVPLKDFRCRRLLLQRLRELARARLHLIEQAHVLDRDHRLVGER